MLHLKLSLAKNTDFYYTTMNAGVKGSIVLYIMQEQAESTNGKHSPVFISSESLLCNCLYRSMLLTSQYNKHLVAVAVDEAHCVKIW